MKTHNSHFSLNKISQLISPTHTIWKFIRPHAFWGTLLQMFVIFKISHSFAGRINVQSYIFALTSILFVHLYGMGINQIFDFEIDLINKPELPIAAGLLTPNQAWWIVLVSLSCSLGIAFIGGSYLLFTVVLLSLALTFYSCPPIHLKKQAWTASLTISLSRGIILPWGIFLYLTAEQGLAFTGDIEIMIFSFFLCSFTSLIAFAKDVPDIEGDRKHSINSLAVRWGPKKVLWLVTSAMALLFILLGYISSLKLEPSMLFCMGQLILAMLVCVNLYLVDPTFSHKHLKKYYMNLWKIFYLEFALFLLS